MFPMVFYSTFFSYYQMPISTEFGCTYAEFSVANVMSTIASIKFKSTERSGRRLVFICYMYIEFALLHNAPRFINERFFKI